MHDSYTLQEAMARLGFKSANAFFQLARKHPDAFVVIKQGLGRDTRYHKGNLDRFAESREYFKPEKP